MASCPILAGPLSVQHGGGAAAQRDGSKQARAHPWHVHRMSPKAVELRSSRRWPDIVRRAPPVDKLHVGGITPEFSCTRANP